jgi:hypothetical protein
MEKQNREDLHAEIQTMRERFNEKVNQSYWSENGEPVYIFQEETDLEEYADLIEMILKDTAESEMDFICKLMHADEKNR